MTTKSYNDVIIGILMVINKTKLSAAISAFVEEQECKRR